MSSPQRRVIQIAAMAENRVIGKDNKIPWHIPEDTKFFRDTTRGHCCISGRRTFESYPKPPPDRFHVVVTTQKSYRITYPQAAVVSSIEEAILTCENQTGKYGGDIFVCGGSEIYRAAQPLTDIILLTLIHQSFEGDTYFPEFDQKQFKLVSQQDRQLPIPFSFLRYERMLRASDRKI